MFNYKNLLCLLLVIAGLSGCKKENDRAFEQSPDERINETIEGYQTQLSGAQYGWKAIVSPKGGGMYSYYMRFNDSNRVRMVSDFNAPSAGTLEESSYRLKALQQISLVFDTYSYLHLLSDPDAAVNGGNYGVGLESDFEFYFDSTTVDTVKLVGRLNGSKAYFVKATQQEQIAYSGGKLKEIIDSTTAYLARNSFLVLQFPNGQRTAVAIDNADRTFNFSYINANGELINLNTIFSYTLQGIYLKDPILYDGKTFNEVFWDASAKVFYIMYNGTRINITTSPLPIIPIHRMIGIEFEIVSIPPPAGLPGTSALFSSRYSAAKSALLASPYRLTLQWIDFHFYPDTKTMDLEVYISQNTSRFLGVFSYTYTLDNATGIAKFNRTGVVDGNAGLMADYMAPLLGYFDNDNFKLDYYANGATILGLMTSIQNPTFFFTGNLE